MKEFFGGIGLIAAAFIITLVIAFAAGGAYILYLNTLGKATVNAERQVTTHTQQYVQTQQQVLVNLYSDYVAAPDEAHKQASALRVCAQAAMLDPNEYPVQVAPFIATNCQ